MALRKRHGAAAVGGGTRGAGTGGAGPVLRWSGARDFGFLCLQTPTRQALSPDRRKAVDVSPSGALLWLESTVTLNQDNCRMCLGDDSALKPRRARYGSLSVSGWTTVPAQDRRTWPPSASIGKRAMNVSDSSSVRLSLLPFKYTISARNRAPQNIRHY